MEANVIDKEAVVSPELARVAELELNETPEARERCIEALIKLLQEDKSLKARVDDAFLLR